MHYPWWYVPHLTAPMLIAVVAVLHVLVAHYAVGGGFFLAIETGYAYRTRNREYLEYLRRHARFFILLTVVFGAISGVGIWWTIGLASPLTTAVLIRTFVFGWAIEYVAFLAEIVSAFIFYYYWGRLPEKTHVAMAWIYAGSAWVSLVVITCITAFMLTPGDWLYDQSFWTAMLNPQAIPQIVARTGGALLLTSLYVYLHASIMIKDRRLHDLIEGRSTRPALAGAAMITVGGAAWYVFLPESARAALYTAGALNVLMALIFAATVVVFLLLYFGPYRNPGWIASPGFAASLLLFGVAAFSTGEFIREAVRKPYVSYNVVLANQVLANEVPRLQRYGYLEGGTWTKAFVQQNYPHLIADGHIDRQRLKTLGAHDKVILGSVIYQYHCNDCHAIEYGYSAIVPLIRGWTPGMIREVIDELNRTRFVMPPWSGTPEEADLLTAYLASIAKPLPQGMIPMTAGGPQ